MRLALLLLIALTGCEPPLDCFDQGQLQASYNNGEREANAENAAELEKGRQVGLSLTETDGRADGTRHGYSDGFLTGHARTYGGGYDDGYTDGGVEGASDPGACADGTSAGLADGEAAGYDDGYAGGYADGASTGYSDGYSAGLSTCGDGLARAPADEEAADPGDVRECFLRGHETAYDPSSFERGLAAGKAANPNYQRGYQATYPTAFTRGVRKP